MTHWSTYPIFDSYLLVAVATLALTLLLLVGPSFRRLEGWQRWCLVGLRFLVILLLLLAMLRPTHVSSTIREQTTTLLVLLDQSRSMQLPSGSGTQSRWEAQRETLEAAAAAFAELEDTVDLKFYTFDGGLRQLPFEGGRWQFPESPEGDQTDIGTSLHEAVRHELGTRLAGVILMGDGVQTAFQPRVEMQQAAREMARLDYPLFTIPFGQPASAAQMRDIAVENLPEQFSVFAKNELLVRAGVRISGYVNQPIPVRLIVEDEQGQRQTVATTQATARQDGQTVPVEMSYIPEQPGQYQLIVEAEERPGELVTSNNRLSAFLRVLEGGLRILYVEGELRQEQIFLRRSIDGSPDMQLDFQWIDRRLQDQWPVSLPALNSDPPYDVFLFGDVDSTAFRPEDLQTIRDAVEAGAGFMMLGGYHSFGPGGYHATPLADLLPIEMTPLERQDFDGPLREDLHLPGPIELRPARPHSIVELASGQRPEQIWTQLAPLQGANRFSAVKDAAGVQVLLESADRQPILVSGPFGQGRVLAFGGDSTWQWWRQGQEDWHRRFWRQSMLWLVGREDQDRSDVWINLDRRRLVPGSDVEIEAGARTAMGDPLPDAQLAVELISPDGSRREVQLSAGAEGSIGRLEQLTEPGTYTVEAVAERAGAPLGTASVNFQVIDHDVELANPAADPQQMARLAAITESAGGRLLAPEELPSLLQEIRQQPPETEVEIETRWQFADSAGDAWLFFLLLVALLTGEWTLRKRWGLV